MSISPPNIGPGERWTGLLDPLPGEAPAVPCTIVRGERPGPTMLVTAGVHGAEYASIAAAQRLATMEPGELQGTLVVVPIVNTAAYFARSIYVNPLDGKNLNRVFPGSPHGSASERLAHWMVKELFSMADVYVDLHGGDLVEALVPFVLHQTGDREAQALAEAFGLDFRIASAVEGATTATAQAMGIPSVLAEAGGQGLWPEGCITALADGTKRAMQHIGMVDEAPPVTVVSKAVSRFAWSRAEVSGCWYPTVTAGDEVEEGQSIGIITDLLGVQVQTPTSIASGTVLFSVSSMAMNAGDPLVGVGVV